MGAIVQPEVGQGNGLMGRNRTTRGDTLDGVRRRLIEMREERGLTREALAERLDCNVRSVTRWEAGQRTPQMAQRVALAEALDRPLADVLRALDDHEDGRLNGHRVSRLGHLVGLEQGAGELWTFETTVVPGLLQTEAYATAVERVAPDRPAAAEVARRVSLRLRRQTALDSLHLRALVDASVLLRVTGGSEVMARQVDHLRSMAARPNVEIRILPLDERAHAAGRGSFMVFTSPDDDLPFMVTIDTAAGVEYLGKPHEVAAHVELWRHLWRIADDLDLAEGISQR
ncbi:MAG TPA: helix-turn-helix transcriptional regulator [Acidimicrobiales bacterium]|jgi:transcriptional regulator with XRE-family HTH domain|nr:helix-turn-helix transcriptional regulator [Acidimicrobiales bacterium]